MNVLAPNEMQGADFYVIQGMWFIDSVLVCIEYNMLG